MSLTLAIISSAVLAGAGAFSFGLLQGRKEGAEKVFRDIRDTGSASFNGNVAYGYAVSEKDYSTEPTDTVVQTGTMSKTTVCTIDLGEGLAFHIPQAEIVTKMPQDSDTTVSLTIQADAKEARRIIGNLSHEATVKVRGVQGASA